MCTVVLSHHPISFVNMHVVLLIMNTSDATPQVSMHEQSCLAAHTYVYNINYKKLINSKNILIYMHSSVVARNTVREGNFGVGKIGEFGE